MFACFRQIITLVDMATYSFQSLVMGKMGIDSFLLSQWGYFYRNVFYVSEDIFS